MSTKTYGALTGRHGPDRLAQDLKNVFRAIFDGDWQPGGKLITISGRVKNLREATATPDTLKLTDEYVLVNVGSASALTLPLNPTRGQTIIVADSSGNAVTNTITISAPGGVSLNGVVAGSIPISINYHRRTFVYNGTAWFGS